MGLRVVAVELRRGGEVHHGACAAMPHLPGLADELGWVLALVARAAADRSIWIRRGRCAVCRRTHALLPDLVLARRLDEVAVIGRGIALRVIADVGLRPIATQLDVPHTTIPQTEQLQTRALSNDQ
jgi:hypothetical protein